MLRWLAWKQKPRLISGNQSGGAQNELRFGDLEVTFLEEAIVIFTTVSGCKERILQSINDNAFDLVIIDEAGQVHEAGVLPALGVEATRFVLVGDPKQLPATVSSQTAKRFHFELSLFERLQLGGYPSHMLQTQYGMHPSISQFPSMHFYMGQLKDNDLIKSRGEFPYLRQYVFYDVGNGVKQSSSSSSSFFNERESVVCYELYNQLQDNMKLHGQKDEIRVGQERDVIILSCVRTQD
ncbi:helicase Sen1-like protein isoform X2 [Tanacetum coccineum]